MIKRRTIENNLKCTLMRTISFHIPIAYVEIRFYAHATEDPEKVVEAANNIFPQAYLENITFKKDNLKGHHGNPIILFQTKIKNKEIIQALIQNLAANLNALDKEILRREINRHVENGNLYIRLDKQGAFHGEFKLYGVDPIHLRIRFKTNKLENIIAACEQIGII